MWRNYLWLGSSLSTSCWGPGEDLQKYSISDLIV